MDEQDIFCICGGTMQLRSFSENFNVANGFTVSDRFASWAKASIYMRLASRSLEAGKRGSFSTLGHLFEAIRYFSYSRKIENHEFCTLVVKRDR